VNRLAPDKEALLLAAIRRHGRIGWACDDADVGLRSIQRLKKRDAAFKARVVAAFRDWLRDRAKGRRHRYPYRARRGQPIR